MNVDFFKERRREFAAMLVAASGDPDVLKGPWREAFDPEGVVNWKKLWASLCCYALSREDSSQITEDRSALMRALISSARGLQSLISYIGEKLGDKQCPYVRKRLERYLLVASFVIPWTEVVVILQNYPVAYKSIAAFVIKHIEDPFEWRRGHFAQTYREGRRPPAWDAILTLTRGAHHPQEDNAGIIQNLRLVISDDSREVPEDARSLLGYINRIAREYEGLVEGDSVRETAKDELRRALIATTLVAPWPPVMATIEELPNAVEVAKRVIATEYVGEEYA